MNKSMLLFLGFFMIVIAVVGGLAYTGVAGNSLPGSSQKPQKYTVACDVQVNDPYIGWLSLGNINCQKTGSKCGGILSGLFSIGSSIGIGHEGTVEIWDVDGKQASKNYDPGFSSEQTLTMSICTASPDELSIKLFDNDHNLKETKTG
jgi:hypothetical protein